MSAEPTWPREDHAKVEVDRWALDVLFAHVNVTGYGVRDGYIVEDVAAVGLAHQIAGEALAESVASWVVVSPDGKDGRKGERWPTEHRAWEEATCWDDEAGEGHTVRPSVLPPTHGVATASRATEQRQEQGR